MNFSCADMKRVKHVFENVEIVLLQEHFDRRIFHEEQRNPDNNEEDEYDHTVRIACLQEPIGITEICTFNECLSYLQICRNKKIFLILPNALSVARWSAIRNCPKVSMIYQLDPENLWIAEQLNDNSFPFSELLDQLTQLFHWMANSETTLHPLTEQDISGSSKNIDGDSRMFIIYQLLVEVILKSLRTETNKRDFIDYTDQIYLSKGRFGKDIAEFKSNFTPSKAIYWYTRPSFVYRLLSRTCCLNNIRNVFRIRYFICGLHDQLKELHLGSLLRFGNKLCVYRGKSMTNNEFLQIKKNIGNLIITKTFLSTTIDRDVAIQFAGINLPEGKVAVIFCMTIDTAANQTKPFAYIASQSCNQDEKEVLISIGTIFKSVSIKKIEVNKL